MKSIWRVLLKKESTTFRDIIVVCALVSFLTLLLYSITLTLSGDNNSAITVAAATALVATFAAAIVDAIALVAAATFVFISGFTVVDADAFLFAFVFITGFTVVAVVDYKIKWYKILTLFIAQGVLLVLATHVLLPYTAIGSMILCIFILVEYILREWTRKPLRPTSLDTLTVRAREEELGYRNASQTEKIKFTYHPRFSGLHRRLRAFYSR